MYVRGLSMGIVDTEKAVGKDIIKKFVMTPTAISIDALEDIPKPASIIGTMEDVNSTLVHFSTKIMMKIWKP